MTCGIPKTIPEKCTTEVDLHDLILFFETVWEGRKPFAKLFRTEFGEYLYDPGTNKIMKCGETVSVIIEAFQTVGIRPGLPKLIARLGDEKLTGGVRELREAMENEQILMADPGSIRFESLHFSNLRREVEYNLGQLILEITQECNLRCSYCVYNDIVHESRGHGDGTMDLRTALSAIEYLAGHSSSQEAPSVSFYGGEPLLRFPFVETCVASCRTLFGNRQVEFAITTNATTVTREIADFLSRENFGITVSIDGPRDIHDRYRVFGDGSGSFESAMAGLKLLVDTYGERAGSKINLSMVYAPPFSSQRLERIRSLWEGYPWLEKIGGGITYPHDGSIPSDKISTAQDLMEDRSLLQWAMDAYFDCYVGKRKLDPLVKFQVDRLLLRIFQRPVFEGPVPGIHLNGCCVPGARKIHVSTDGFISVCERVHLLTPPIGHVDTGIDFDLLQRTFVATYAEQSLTRCAGCWAQRFCGLCYADAFSNHEFDNRRKSFVCEGVIDTAEEQLKLYTRLLHVNPEGLNYLADIAVS